MLYIGHWALYPGHWTLYIGHWTLYIGQWKLYIWRWMFYIGHWTSDIIHFSLYIRRWTWHIESWKIKFYFGGCQEVIIHSAVLFKIRNLQSMSVEVYMYCSSMFWSVTFSYTALRYNCTEYRRMNKCEASVARRWPRRRYHFVHHKRHIEPGPSAVTDRWPVSTDVLISTSVDVFNRHVPATAS